MTKDKSVSDIGKVGLTAFGPMAQIALEQFFPEGQRIVHDELAYRFMPGPLKLLVQICRLRPIRQWMFRVSERRAPGVRGGVLCRKRYIDDRLRESLDTGISTIVILGSGLDTHAYRPPASSAARVYELDLPANIEYKRRKLRQLYGTVPTRVALVPVDFNDQEWTRALHDSGYSTDQRSFFVWEGVTQYISEPVVRRVFEFLAEARPGSRLVFTYIVQDFIDGAKTYGLEALYRRARIQEQFWHFGIQPEAIPAFIGAYSWSELEQVGTCEYRERYLEPAGRTEAVMEIERAVHAEKTAG